MERLIVNEGQGGKPHDLSAAVTRVGSGPDCDIVLRGEAAAGCKFVIERTRCGHAVRVVSGDVYHNEQTCLAADLLHNDTLRAGDSLVLYKNPTATLPAPAPPADVEPFEKLKASDEVVFEPETDEQPVADVAATGARPLAPDDVVRFRRPLPAGRSAPTFLPPAHPGRPAR